MRFIFDTVSYLVLFLALVGMLGGIALGGFGLLIVLNGNNADLSGGLLLLWGMAALFQGSILALATSYCRLRIEATDRPPR